MTKVGNATAKKKLYLSLLFCYQSMMTISARTMLMSMGSVHDVIIATVIAGVQEFIARSSIVLIDNFVNKHVYRRAFDRKLREQQLEVWAADICGSMAIEHTAILLMGIVELLFLRHASAINVGGGGGLDALREDAVKRGVVNAHALAREGCARRLTRQFIKPRDPLSIFINARDPPSRRARANPSYGFTGRTAPWRADAPLGRSARDADGRGGLRLRCRAAAAF